MSIIESKNKLAIYPLIALFLLLGVTSLIDNQYGDIEIKNQLIMSDSKSQILLEKVLISTEYSLHSEFSINGNEEFIQTVNEKGWSGEGNINSPFLIENLNITGGIVEKNLIDIKNTDVHFSIQNCLLKNGEVAIHLSNVFNGRIVNNRLSENKKGIILENSKQNYIDDNTITNTRGICILIKYSNENRIIKNIIVNTTVYGGFGIFLHESESCLISFNYISNIQAYAGIWLDFNSNLNNVSSNTIENTNGNGMVLGSIEGNSNKNTILNNSISNNNNVGIRLYNSNDNNIRSNAIFQNGDYGLYLEKDCRRNAILNNSIEKNLKTGVYIQNSHQNTFQNNFISNNSQDGIKVIDSMNTLFFRNSITHNNQLGIYLTVSAENSLVMLNGFVENDIKPQGLDDGVNNNFSHNYWSDKPETFESYSLGGLTTTKDNHPSVKISDLNEQIRVEPKITYPNGGEMINGIVPIKWKTSSLFRSFSIQNFPFSLYYSSDGGLSWNLISSYVTGTFFIWNTPSDEIGLVYLVKIVTPDYLGFTEVDISNLPFIILNMPQLIISLLLLTLLIISSFFVLQKRGKLRIGRIEQKPKLVHNEFLLSMCLGSFTDNGFLVQFKTDVCNFEDQELQSMSDYSSVLYQHGETERFYGPFPKKTFIQSESFVWHYLSFSFSTKDPSITDSRIIAQEYMVPVLLLLIYPQEDERVISIWKDEIKTILKESTESVNEISSLNKEWLMRVESRIRKILTD